eukprot:CAMPEP_0195511730 /NCGR_PEP_ID=MMETSP0794_2-20130614/3952_1 /TAXON_ID=515487 /ORGANISM="Stephanopyxis turris, Strain CCMP 815" /LENGTH=233 /DNA_ID=CAMNT_0040639383 /DNA_START=124 /DNA_END=825 /DNA_ORIENTATION=+
MKLLSVKIAFVSVCGILPAVSFNANTFGSTTTNRRSSLSSTARSATTSNRRAFFEKIATATATATATGLASITTEPNAASAAPSLPTVTVSEFETILKESSKSIQLVEFSGPQSETILVKLVDGTSFGISDAKESATDPRSPLKVLATCKGYKVPTKFTGLEAALSTSTTKRKKYANNRVQEAAVREEAKRERMAQDERDRLAAVYKMQQQEEEELAAEMGVKAVVVPEVPDD